MPEASDDRVSCPNCGKAYRWKPDLAGRKVACKCGQKMRLPDTAAGSIEPLGPPPDPNEASTYGLDVNEESQDGVHVTAAAPSARQPASGRGKCPACNQPLKPGAVLCVNCGFNLQSGKQLHTDVAEDAAADDGDEDAALDAELRSDLVAVAHSAGFDPTKAKVAEQNDHGRLIDFHLPLAFILLGVVGTFAGGIWLAGSFNEGLIAGGVLLGIQLLIMTPLLLLAVILTAYVMGINFGYLGTGVFKLSAICIGPGAWGDVVALLVLPFFPGLFAGIFISSVIYLIFLGTPLSVMFKLDFHETATTVAVAIMVRLFSFLLVLTTLFALMV